jgi:hypothetical protein
MKVNCDNSVGIAMGYGLEGRGSISGRGKRLPVLYSVQIDSRAHLTFYQMGTRVKVPQE